MKNLVGVISFIFFSLSDGARGFEFEDCDLEHGSEEFEVFNEPATISSSVDFGSQTLLLVPESGKVLLIEKLEVTPHPIIVAENVTVSAAFRLKEDIYPNATVKVEIVRIKPDGIIPEYKVPCFKTLGSCKFNASSYFQLQKETICQFFANLEDCKLPLKAGIYQGDNISISLPLLEEFGFLAEAKYESLIKILEAGTDRLLVCIKLISQVKLKGDCEQSSTKSFP